MNRALVDKIVNAVLYEGYILYPYRPSVKNRQRWTFGGLYPRSYCETQKGSDAWAMQTECLVRADARPKLEVTVRFLHLLARQVGELDQPQPALKPGAEPSFRVVESLRVGDRLWHTWQEAAEREVALDNLDLGSLSSQPRRTNFAFPGSRQFESLRGPRDEIIGVIVRDQQPLAGSLEVSAEPVSGGFKVRVRIENNAILEETGSKSRDEVLMRSLVSTHTILGVQDGEFVSLLAPPDDWRERAAACQNVGNWPVLVGEARERDTMLSSPIILYDYPQIAPESPGDFFDGAEIDEMLVLRILTLSDEEKQAMVAVDERARTLLQRTEALTPEQMLGLHGTVRGLRAVATEDGHERLGSAERTA
jgi:hypothetical protein